MKERIAKMFKIDVLAIFFMMGVLWIVIGYVLFLLLSTFKELNIRIAVTFAGVSVTVFATSVMLAVINHLKRNKDEIYMEELRHEHDEQIEKGKVV